MHDKLLKHFTGELTKTETDTLFDAMQTDADLKAEFVRLQNIYAMSHLSRLSIDREEGRKALEGFNKRKTYNTRKLFIYTSMKYAAMAIVLIASTFFATRSIYNNVSTDEVMNTLYVPAGQRAKLTLQDGSTVWLNANSTLTYPSKFARKGRNVSVEGEAYFDITPNNKKPFVVNTKDVNMRVLGTQFNVHSYPETDFIRTDLIEGSLLVYKSNFEAGGITLKPNEQLTVTGNQMLLSKIESDNYFLWKDGVYAFENKKLTDIIDMLQLYYDVKIIVEDPEIFNVPYTGKFRQRDGIDEILRILQKIRKFNIIKDSDNNIITITK